MLSTSAKKIVQYPSPGSSSSNIIQEKAWSLLRLFIYENEFFQILAKDSLNMATTRTWGWWSSAAIITVGTSTTVMITPAVKEDSEISIQWACEQLQVWCDLPEAGSGQTIKESLCDNRGHSLKTDRFRDMIGTRVASTNSLSGPASTACTQRKPGRSPSF